MSYKIVSYCNWDIRDNGTAKRIATTLRQMFGEKAGRMRRPVEKWPESELFLFVDDGRGDIPMDKAPSPSACYLIDVHLGFQERIDWARLFDYVFVAQKFAVPQFAEHGIKAHWLPLACHPNADPCLAELMLLETMIKLGQVPGPSHNPFPNLNKQFDTAFVGFLNRGIDGKGHDRVKFLDAIFRAFPNSWLSFQNFFEDAAVRYIKARVGLNISIAASPGDLNMRFFEGLSYGSCLLSNRDQDGWQELGFEDGVHFLGFDTYDEAIERVRWALDHPMEREAIAAAGHTLVREKHTYRHRMEQMFATIGAAVETVTA